MTDSLVAAVRNAIESASFSGAVRIDVHGAPGFWLASEGPGAQLEGYDAGVSFRSVDDPVTGITWTVVSNTSEGAWSITRCLADHLAA